MQEKKYIGIDLGTSNSSLSFFENDELKTLEVEQFQSKASTVEKPYLDSCLYIPKQNEFTQSEMSLSWGQQENIVGDFAKNHGALNPDRLISSAKSWLCQNRIAREDQILPWNSKVEKKYSPVEASSFYLKHLISSLKEDLKSCVTITVPASFDEVARELTVKAAKKAGIEELILLEEPQAAFYSWISSKGEAWRDDLCKGDVVLVCDLGGGTSDFSLIAIDEEDGQLVLERLSVGDHLLLGGDNMDLALAYMLKAKHEASGSKLDAWQLMSLTLQVKQAKEKLLSDLSLSEVNISVSSRGSSLFASALSFKLDRSELEKYLVNGFFPVVDETAHPKVSRQLGLQAMGLKYETDPAITKHLVSFLRKAKENVCSNEKLKALSEKALLTNDELLVPNKILFNGGVFKSDTIRNAVLESLQLLSNEDVFELSGASYDLAVSRGASYYSKLKQTGEGLRIKAGTSRSYYLGVEPSTMAIPGFTPALNGLCVVEQGAEEGQSSLVSNSEFAVLVGDTVSFRFFSSSSRAGDCAGDLIEACEDVLEETSALTKKFELEGAKKGELIPVVIESEINELGLMNISLKETNGEKKWKLDFDLRAYES